MIVGLKRRRNSHDYYELGTLMMSERRLIKKIRYADYEVINEPNNWHTSVTRVYEPSIITDKDNTTYLVKTFEGRFTWLNDYLCDKLCDYITPNECTRTDCPNKFRCYTMRVE
jgi:hypothetical protein